MQQKGAHKLMLQTAWDVEPQVVTAALASWAFASFTGDSAS